MKPHELLISRYEIIGDYPGNEIPVGSILIKSMDDIFQVNDGDMCCHIENIDTYPSLFRKMLWFEKRSMEDMPSKVMSQITRNVHEIESWDMDNLIGHVKGDSGSVCDLLIYTPQRGYIPVD